MEFNNLAVSNRMQPSTLAPRLHFERTKFHELSISPRKKYSKPVVTDPTLNVLLRFTLSYPTIVIINHITALRRE